MKVYIRSFLILLLAFAMPINGMAQLLMPMGPSTSHVMPDMQNMTSSSSPMVGTQPGCCANHEQGKSLVCKVGQECKTSSILQLAVANTPQIPAAKPLRSFYNQKTPSLLLDTVWHPPRT